MAAMGTPEPRMQSFVDWLITGLDTTDVFGYDSHQRDDQIDATTGVVYHYDYPNDKVDFKVWIYANNKTLGECRFGEVKVSVWMRARMQPDISSQFFYKVDLHYTHGKTDHRLTTSYRIADDHKRYLYHFVGYLRAQVKKACEQYGYEYTDVLSQELDELMDVAKKKCQEIIAKKTQPPPLSESTPSGLIQ